MPAFAGEICLLDLAHCQVFCFMHNSIFHCFDKIQDSDILNMTVDNFVHDYKSFSPLSRRPNASLLVIKQKIMMEMMR